MSSKNVLRKAFRIDCQTFSSLYSDGHVNIKCYTLNGFWNDL